MRKDADDGAKDEVKGPSRAKTKPKDTEPVVEHAATAEEPAETTADAPVEDAKAETPTAEDKPQRIQPKATAVIPEVVAMRPPRSRRTPRRRTSAAEDGREMTSREMGSQMAEYQERRCSRTPTRTLEVSHSYTGTVLTFNHYLEIATVA